ncbi:MAG: type II secretion system protein F [Lachnospiraceae bacterium]|nr:type II secretion system protein F [Lachnospiraceae bacterium]
MDYETYRMGPLEKAGYAALYEGLFVLIGFLFYGNPLAGLPGVLLLPFCIKRKSAGLGKKRRQELLLQFKELILSYSNSLKVGYSIENALREAYKELGFLYREEDMIMQECRDMMGKLQNNHTIDSLFMDFGKRSGLREIRDFAEVFAVAKKAGGNLPAIIGDSAQRIALKMTENEQIALLFAAKKFEQRIMDLVPIVIILYIGVTSPGYFDPLYGNVAGIVIMTLCLGAYLAAFLWSEKIMDIEW